MCIACPASTFLLAGLLAAGVQCLLLTPESEVPELPRRPYIAPITWPLRPRSIYAWKELRKRSYCHFKTNNMWAGMGRGYGQHGAGRPAHFDGTFPASHLPSAKPTSMALILPLLPTLARPQHAAAAVADTDVGGCVHGRFQHPAVVSGICTVRRLLRLLCEMPATWSCPAKGPRWPASLHSTCRVY